MSIESSISISNLQVVCKHCSRPARIGFMISKEGAKSRYCKACREVI